MKTLIFIILSFQSFAQDSIPCPCDLNRQQTRLFFSAYEKQIKLDETHLKLIDDQHKRENTKEIKELRYGFKSLRVENATIRKQFKLTKDSLKRSNALSLKQEKNRSNEAIKEIRKEKNALNLEFKTFKRESKSIDLAKRTEIRKLRTWIYGLILLSVLIWILLLYVKFKK